MFDFYPDLATYSTANEVLDLTQVIWNDLEVVAAFFCALQYVWRYVLVATCGCNITTASQRYHTTFLCGLLELIVPVLWLVYNILML